MFGVISPFCIYIYTVYSWLNPGKCVGGVPTYRNSTPIFVNLVYYVMVYMYVYIYIIYINNYIYIYIYIHVYIQNQVQARVYLFHGYSWMGWYTWYTNISNLGAPSLASGWFVGKKSFNRSFPAYSSKICVPPGWTPANFVTSYLELRFGSVKKRLVVIGWPADFVTEPMTFLIFPVIWRLGPGLMEIDGKWWK